MRVSARLFSQLKQQQQHSLQPKLIYQGKLSNRILYLKSVSLISSLGLAGSYKYVLAKKGFSVALAGVGFAFTPFLLSPIIISWFFKRYITRLYYDPTTATYTAHHYGLLLNKKQCTFKSEDVIRSDFTSMLNTFKVGKKPFFIHDEDLVDAESVEIYKKMIGLDQVKPVADDDDGADKSAAAAKQFK